MISARRKPSTQALGHPAPPEQKTTTQSKRVADLKDQAWGSSGNRTLLLGLPLPTAVDISGEERDGVCQYLPSRRLENGHPMQAAAKTRLFWSLGFDRMQPSGTSSALSAQCNLPRASMPAAALRWDRSHRTNSLFCKEPTALDPDRSPFHQTFDPLRRRILPRYQLGCETRSNW